VHAVPVHSAQNIQIQIQIQIILFKRDEGYFLTMFHDNTHLHILSQQDNVHNLLCAIKHTFLQ
jgi:hypothetical protein